MAFRLDIARLRPARREKDGRLRVDAHITRAGVFEYLNPDGSIRRELREPEEVFKPESMASFQQVPVTNNHPPVLLTADDARRYMVGMSGENVGRDGEWIRTSLAVADRATADDMEGGKVQVSCGYNCKIDATPGLHPVYGRYDVRQYEIRGNHIAIVEVARAGAGARVRMDGLGDYAIQRADDATLGSGTVLAPTPPGQGSVKLLSVVSGHVHTLDTSCLPPSGVGWTSYAKSEGEDGGHEHAWVRNADGAIEILENAGHTHQIVEDAGTSATATADSAGTRAGSVCLPARTVHTGEAMATSKNDAKKTAETDELLATAAQQLSTEKTRADSAEKAAGDEKLRADQAEGTIVTLRAQIKELTEGRIDSGEIEKRDVTIVGLQRKLAEEKTRADNAESPERLRTAVKARVALETAAAAVMGNDVKMDGFSDRDLMDLVIEKLLGEKSNPERSDDYARACFDTAVQGYMGGKDAMQRLREVVVPQPADLSRIDSKSARQAMIDRNRNASKPRNAQETK